MGYIVHFSLIGFSGFITMVLFVRKMSLEVFFLAKILGKDCVVLVVILY